MSSNNNQAVFFLKAKGPQDMLINPDPNHLLFRSMFKQYPNVGRFLPQLEKRSGADKLKETTDTTITYDLHSGGDITTKLYHSVKVEALTAQGTADFMHLCNCFGHAQFTQMQVLIGGTEIEKMDKETMKVLSDLYLGSGEAIREMLGHYEKESHLIQAAQGTQVIVTPLLAFCARSDDQAIPNCALGDQQILLKLTYDSARDVSVNRGNDATSAHASHCATQIQSPTVFAVQYYIEENERQTYTDNVLSYNLICVNRTHDSTLTSTSVQSASSQFIQPTTCFLFYARQAAATDGTSYTNYGVGLKDYFDFGTASGSEPIHFFDVQTSAGGWQLNHVPPVYFRTAESHYQFDKKCSPFVYAWGAGPKDALCPQVRSTWNMSRSGDQTIKMQVAESSSTQFFVDQVQVKQVNIGNSALVQPFIS